MAETLAVGSVIAKIIGDTSDFKRAVKEARSEASNFTGFVGKGMKDVGSSMKGAGMKTSAFLTAPILGLGLAAVKSAADQEQLRISLETMLGSAEKAQALLEQVANFASTTPFEQSDIEQATKSMLAFGIASEDIIPSLKNIGDISAGVGVPIQDLAVIYGKAKTAGTLFAEDINQLTERGVPIIAALAKQFGVAESEIKKLTSEGKVGFEDLQVAFAGMAGEGGQFNNLMEKQSESLAGQWSNLMDEAAKLARTIGEELAPVAMDLVQAIKGLVAWFGGLSEEQKRAIVVFAGLVAALGPVLIILGSVFSAIGTIITVGSTLVGIVGSIGSVFATVGTIIGAVTAGPVLIAIGIIAALGAAGYLLVKNWDKVKNFIGGIINWIVGKFNWLYQKLVGGSIIPDLVRGVLGWIAKMVNSIGSPIQSMIGFIVWAFNTMLNTVWDRAQGIFNIVRDAFQGVYNAIVQPLQSALGAARSIFDQIKNAIPNIGSSVSGFFGNVRGLLGFQHGGAFTVPGVGGPDSQLIAFRATPGEHVSIKTPEQQSRGGDGVQVNIENANVRDQTDIRAIGQEFAYQASANPVLARMNR